VSTSRKRDASHDGKNRRGASQPTHRRDIGNRNHWNTLFETRVVIGDFKHGNHRHSALGMISPVEYEDRFTQSAQAA
jgi:hypothetical protein